MTNVYTNPNASYMRRGATEIQGILSESRSKKIRKQMTPTELKVFTSSPSEKDTEGSESASPKFNPMSPPYSVQTTESSGKARTQGQGTTLDFTPVPEPEPAVEFVSEERRDMSMLIAPVAMNSAQLVHTNWTVDSSI